MSGFELRVRFPPDDDVISHLHALAFGGDVASVQPWSDRLRSHSVTWVGAFDGEVLVGFVHVVWDGGVHGFLLDTAVHPGRRGEGLGTQVIAAAIDAARGAGCEWLHVDYEPQLESFYRGACGIGPTTAGLLRL